MILPSGRTAQFHYAIRNIVGAAEERERAGRPVIYLNIGDPQAYGFRPPKHVVDAVTDAVQNNFTGYAHSSGLREAREAVANYATKLGAATRPNEVVITSGASEGAELVLTALVNPGDEVLLPAPGYPLYPAILNKLGAVARYYHLDGRNGWQPSIDELGGAITNRTRAILLINPNNPTGSIVPDQTTSEILQLAHQHNLLVIADEVYRELCFETPPTSASVLAEQMDVPIITLESLSKTHLVPGWRVGWMRFTRADLMPDLIRAINRLASGRLCSPTLTQYAIRPALEGDRSFLEEFMLELRRRRDFVIEAVRGIDGISCETPAAAFYAMIRIDDPVKRTDERFVLDLLEETGVLVVHGSGFGADPNEGYFRLVYLANEEILGTVFDRLSHFMKKACPTNFSLSVD